MSPYSSNCLTIHGLPPQKAIALAIQLRDDEPMGGSNQFERWLPLYQQYRIARLIRGGIGRFICVLTCLSVPLAGLAAPYRFNDVGYLGDAALLPDWSQTLDRQHTENSILKACLADKSKCQGINRSLRHLLGKAQALDPQRQTRLVNHYVNNRRYKSDRTTRLVTENSDEPLKYRSRWATMNEFLRRGGDCEDYATTKYFLLRELGFPSERLRVVITRERRSRAYHAVLAVDFGDDEVWLLESNNEIKKSRHFGYRYVYAMNETSIWDHEESTD